MEDPTHQWLVTPFSVSPEHGYFDSNGKLAYLSPAPTMDIAIIRELFPHCIEAGTVLGVDEEFRGKLEAALKRLPPYRINRLGHLQEWIEDWKGGGQGHNCSPNFTIFPGSSITLRGDPKLAAAIEKWMETRRVGGGWPAAWDTAVWARLERADKVGTCIQTFVTKSLANNLHNGGHNQTDANYGFTAAVAEALLQSHAGEINLLPALPPAWADGSVKGLKARGGFEVGIEWKGGKLQLAEIRNASATACKVRCGTKVAEFSLKAGQTIRLNGELAASDDKGKEARASTAGQPGQWLPQQVNPGLPNVLILGDSISVGYTLKVRELLKGKANVFRPCLQEGKQPDNCGDTTKGLENLDQWLGDQKWAVIHFNWGLHDLKYINPEKKTDNGRDKVNGKQVHSPEEYARNLDQLVQRLKATGARLIFATTTVVPEGEPGRIKGDEVKFNRAALDVMKKQGVKSDDLWALTAEFPPELFLKPADVHYSEAGRNKLAEQVAASITAELK